MKSLIVISGLLISMASFASIDATEAQGSAPSNSEISKYRSCFMELEGQGCRHPSEDTEHFVSCMRDSFTSLSSNCQNMMTTLYGK